MRLAASYKLFLFTYLPSIYYNEDKLTFVAKNTIFFLQKLCQTHNHLKMSPND